MVQDCAAALGVVHVVECEDLELLDQVCFDLDSTNAMRLNHPNGSLRRRAQPSHHKDDACTAPSRARPSRRCGPSRARPSRAGPSHTEQRARVSGLSSPEKDCGRSCGYKESQHGHTSSLPGKWGGAPNEQVIMHRLPATQGNGFMTCTCACVRRVGCPAPIIALATLFAVSCVLGQ